MNAIYLEPAMIPPQLRGGYTGKKFKARVVTELTIPADAGLWSGGTRSTYRVVHLETGNAANASDNMSSPWDSSRRDQHITLKPGFAVVEHDIFCGKDMGLTFYVHPDNAAKLIPALPDALSDHESIVLDATCRYKSSYNGLDRYEMARRDTYGEAREYFPTRGDWQLAKDSLIAKGLLAKNGAVTPKGRNARPSRY